MKKIKLLALAKLSFFAAAAFVLNSCGTTSDINLATAGGIGNTRYSKVLVKDFSATVMDRKNQIGSAKKYFPDRIAQEINKTGRFASVKRSGKADAKTLVIDGVVTRYQEGNAALRLLVGMGAGSSYFDSTVNFHNGLNGKPIGSIKVDKNSWGLGGGLAAGQTPTTYMDGAAKKIAKEAVQLAR